MNILLTNDDGIDAGGLKSLAEVFKREHAVWIVAPLKNKSGASSSITMDRELLIEQRAKNEYALDGSPVDCVLSSVNGSYLPSKPDVIISGINSGPNIGTDIVYSGTCAAARQGAIYGIPSIALSVEKKSEENSYKFDALAEFALKNLKNLLVLCSNHRNIEEGTGCEYFLNVNAPSEESYKGVKFTVPCYRAYGDHVQLVKKEDGLLYSNCIGGSEVKSIGSSYCDADAVREGYVSISVMYCAPAADEGFCSKTFF